MASRVHNPYTYAFNFYYVESLIIQAQMRTLSSRIAQSISLLQSPLPMTKHIFSIDIYEFEEQHKTMAEYARVMKKNKEDYCPAKHAVQLTEKDRETRELCTRWEKLEDTLLKEFKRLKPDVQKLKEQLTGRATHTIAVMTEENDIPDREEVNCIMN
jgi:hypothetical protein